MPELIDVYDRNRNRTGKTVFRGENGPGEYRLVTHICVFNCDRMLIQLRSPKKKSLGGYWDVSAGGQVDAGERSEQGAARELCEELGMKRVILPGRRIATVTFDYGFDDFYCLEYNEENIVLQESEVSDWRWASLEEILAMIEARSFIQYSEFFIRKLFELHYTGGFISVDNDTAFQSMNRYTKES